MGHTWATTATRRTAITTGPEKRTINKNNFNNKQGQRQLNSNSKNNKREQQRQSTTERQHAQEEKEEDDDEKEEGRKAANQSRIKPVGLFGVEEIRLKAN